MDKKTILFDLDGTLTDSGEGIINCAALALEHFGIPVPSHQEMRVFVGPPLHETFMRFGGEIVAIPIKPHSRPAGEKHKTEPER